MGFLSCEDTLETISDEDINRELTADRPYMVSWRFILDENTKTLINREMALGVTISEAESRLVVSQEWINYLIERSADEDESSEAIDADPEMTVDFIDLTDMTVLSSINPIELYAGSYEFKFYLKREELNLSPHAGSPQEIACPVPYTLRSPLIAQDVDPSFGLWRGAIQRDQVIEVNLTSQTCGPGDLNTQLTGKLRVPSGLSSAAQKRLMLHLSPYSLGTDNEVGGRPRSSMTFPLASHLKPLDDIDVFSFSLNQIPEGTFTVQIFVDSDGDSLPTPCDLDLGLGGDRWIAEYDDTIRTITRGEKDEMDGFWTLVPVSSCDVLQISSMLDSEINVTTENTSDLAVFLGQVNLTPDVLTALAFSPSKQIWFSSRRRVLPPKRFIGAQKLFSLSEAIIADGRFSVHLNKNVTYDPLEFAVWIDEGYDGALTPCDDPANRGADVWWWEGNSEILSVLLNFDLSQPPPLTPLNISQRCEAPESMVEVQFDLNFIWPENVSTRPLMLVYQDLENGVISQSVITDLDQGQALDYVETPKRTRVQLSPGSYLLSAYIDQDFDDQFTPCSDQVLGDRFSTARGETINLSSGDIMKTVLSLTPRECPYLESQLLMSLKSDLTDLALTSSELSADSLMGQRTCQSREVSVHVSDRNPLNSSYLEQPEDILMSQYCISVNHLPHALDLLPAGHYHLSACALMSTSAIDQALSEVSLSNTPGTWGGCVSPQYWWASSDVHITLSGAQSVELKLTPRCTCD